MKREQQIENKAACEQMQTSYVIRPLQVKTTMTNHDTPIRMANIPKSNNTKHWQRNRNSHSLLVGMQNGTATLEDSLGVFYRTKQNLTIPSSNCAPWYLYPNEFKTYVYTKTCTWIFIVALFRIAKSWEQPRCPAVSEWINCSTSRQWNIIWC